MTIQGSAERILDSVLPHEVTHMIYASHFRQPLPRWADEGGATSMEHFSEKNKQRQMLVQFLQTGRGIAFSQMFTMTEYPQDIMPLYAQGYSLAEFLIQSGGHRKYIAFLDDGLENDDWAGAIHRHYQIADLPTLQETWLTWVRQGWPALKPRETQPPVAANVLATNEQRTRPEPNLLYLVRDKQAPAEPLAALVPVRFPSQNSNVSPTVANNVTSAVAQIAPARSNSAAIRWIDPRRTISTPADRIAASDAHASSSVLPTAGWRPSGDTATKSLVTTESSDPTTVETARPQPFEQASQTSWK
jgi:hypothetical protein